ncbi:MAG: hypothetical protein HQK83_05055 [Fibrobacteria bacterium]|nr:hypothetical protein [Fibrobacteria bacterium]
MKIMLIPILVLSLFIGFGFTEDDSTAVYQEKFGFTGYVEPMLKFTPVDQQFGMMAGLEAGIVLDWSFSVGIAGHSLIWPVEPNVAPEQQLVFNYGGLTLDWIIRPFEMVHGGFSVLIGAGYTAFSDSGLSEEGFLVVEPEWFFTVNTCRFAQVQLGFGLRFIYHDDGWFPHDYVKDFTDLNQLVATLGVRFGKFKIEYE